MKSIQIISTLFLALLGSVFAGVLGINPLLGATVMQVMHFIPMPVGILGVNAITSNVLKTERGNYEKQMLEMHNKAKEENRFFDDEERKKYDELKEKRDGLDPKIKEVEEREELEARNAARHLATTQQEKEKKEIRNFSMLKAMRMAVDGKIDGKDDGFYLEMHQEADKELRELGLSVAGFGIPQLVLHEKRDLTAGTASEGGATVPTELRGFIDYLKEYLVLTQLGAKTLTGLKGDLSIPRGKTIASAAWEGETDDTAETSPTFENVTAEPHRLAAFTEISKQLLLQSSIDVEQYINELLAYAVAYKLQYSAINGDGSSGAPTGILYTSGIGSYSIGTNGGAPTYAMLVGLEKEVDIDNALMGKLGYLTNMKVKAKLKTTKIDTGSGLFLAAQDAKILNSHPAAYSGIVPSNLTKGTGAALSAMIFGNWNDLIMGQWGGLDITADKNSLAMAKAGKVAIVINSFWDIIVRHAASFSACIDIDSDLT